MRNERTGPDPELVGTVVEAVGSYRGEIVRLTQELVAIATENPPGRRYGECVDVLRGAIRDLGLEADVVEVPSGADGGEEPREASEPRRCLLARYGDDGPALIFHGHYDVVPAQDDGQFEPAVRDERLYGRGAADMKGGIAAMLAAVRALEECAVPLAGHIGLCLVPDEETGSALGTGYLADHGHLGRDGVGMLTPEPTGGVVWNASRGALSLRIRIRGREAHSGLYHKGDNAFEKMVTVARRLADYRREVETRMTHFDIGPEEARRSVLLVGGECSSGVSFNAVPGECAFTVDRRINPEEDLEEERERIFELLEELRGRGIELDVEVIQEGETSATPEESPLACSLAGTIEEVTEAAPRFELCPGLLETRFYARAGVPALAYGPGRLEVAHGPDEHVAVHELVRCAAVYALTAADLLSPAAGEARRSDREA